MHRLRSLDLRFINDQEEVSFQAMREPDLLRWTRLGAIVFGICTVVHGFSTIGPEVEGRPLPAADLVSLLLDRHRFDILALGLRLLPLLELGIGHHLRDGLRCLRDHRRADIQHDDFDG